MLPEESSANICPAVCVLGFAIVVHQERRRKKTYPALRPLIVCSLTSCILFIMGMVAVVSFVARLCNRTTTSQPGMSVVMKDNFNPSTAELGVVSLTNIRRDCIKTTWAGVAQLKHTMSP
jgi:hypothetical protein